MNIFQTCLRWTYRIFWYSLVGLVITLAVAISLIRIFPPDVEVYREQVEQLASKLLERQVTIDSMDARLSGFTPQIIFNNVHLMTEDGRQEIIRFEKASLGIDLFRSLSDKKLIPKSFTIYGVNLGITRKRDGTFLVQGLKLEELEQQIGGAADIIDPAANELSEWLFQRSELAIKDSTVVWVDRIRGKKTRRFEHVNFYLRNNDNRHQLTGTVTLPPELGRDFEVSFDIDGNILDPKEWQGNFFAKGHGLQITNWGVKPAILEATLEKGVLDLSIWGEWKSGRVNSIVADISTYNVSLNFDSTANNFDVALISGLINWKRRQQGWMLNVSNFSYLHKAEIWPKTEITVNFDASDNNSPLISAYSSFIRLGDVKQVLIEGGFLDKDSLNFLGNINPAGDLNELNLKYRLNQKDNSDFVLSTKFKGLSVDAWKYFPGVRSMDGDLWMSNKQGVMKFLNRSSQLEFPRLFRKPFDITRMDGQVQWWHQDQAWHISSNDLFMSTRDIESDMSLSAIIPDYDASPYFDLQVHYINGDAKQAWRYYPVSIMDEDLVDWLDRGFVNGTVTEGGAIFNGRLADFPFADKSGSLLADFDTVDAEIHYQQDWPNIKDISARATITGLGLTIKGESAKLFDTTLKNVDVRIDDFEAPALMIDSQVKGYTSDVIQYLVESPIASEARGFYQKSNISGTGTGKVKVIVPLSDSVEEFVPLHYEGYADFKNSRLSSWNETLEVNNINGHIDFGTRGVFSDDLTGDVYGGKTGFRIFTQEKNQRQNIQISMKGELDSGVLRKYINLKLLDRIKGKADWQGVLSFTGKDKDESGSFQFTSDMKGVEVNLPPPLVKTASRKRELSVTVRFPDKDTLPVLAHYGGILSFDLLANIGDSDKGFIKKGTVQLYSGKARLPDKDQLVIRGGMLEFPIGAWVDIFDDNQRVSSKPILNMIGAPVILDMDYLQITTREDSRQSRAADPRKAALINGKIADLKINDRHFGNVTINTSRVKDGIAIKKLQIYSDVMKIDVEGGWYLRRGRQQTNLVLNVSTDDLGEMLAKLGYSAIIRNGKAKAVMQADWYDSPDRFDLSKLNGSLGVIIDDGLIRDVEPGVGRLLGLLSLAELPRRIIGDFGEFREGFKFNQIYGQFDIEDGDANTDNLRVISPIALISINGRTGLAKRDFDQHVTVVPNVSGTVPIIGWLVWGGQIGAFTFILDQLFGEDFDKSAATKYHITGSWEKPIITRIEQDPLDTPEE